MEELISGIVDTVTNFMSNFGFLSGFLLIVIESILPILPLAVFIALNIITFGQLFGFLISWIATVIGCMLAFYICRKLKYKYAKKYENNTQINRVKTYINKLSFSNLVIILSVPFTPAFAINIGAGLSDIDPKRYFLATFIGKVPMVYFWGFIGKSLLESITDPYTIAQISIMLIVAYLVSKLVNNFIK